MYDILTSSATASFLCVQCVLFLGWVVGSFHLIMILQEEVNDHWRELPQVSFFAATNTCLLRQNTSFGATNVCLARQTRRDKYVIFVATSILLSRQTRVCLHETFVATKKILMAAPANDSKSYIIY